MADYGLACTGLGKGGFDVEPVAEEGGAAIVDVDVDDGHAVAAVAEEFGQPVVVEIVPAGFFEEFEIAGVVDVAVYVEVVAAYGEVGVVWHGGDGNGRRTGCRPLVLQGLEGFAFHFAGGQIAEDGGELDVEPFGKDVGVQIGPLAFVFAPVGQLGGENGVDLGFDFRPHFFAVIAGVGEVGVGVVLQVFEGEVAEFGTGQGGEPVPKRL